MKDLAAELLTLEKNVAFSFGNILHPAGGLSTDFVYEPLDTGEYVYRTKDGKKDVVRLQVEYEDPDKKRGPNWKIEVEGKPYYFSKKPPKQWLFPTPERSIIQKWIDTKKQSLTTENIWNLNSTYLRTFLDFPHPYEFSATLLFIQQTWLAEILPVVFYLGIKGEYGGGKTVTGEAIVKVSKHGYLTGNLSPPFVARAIEDQKITLMVDELDSLAGTKDSDLNSIFRQGYRRGSKYSRVNPDTLESESKEIFGPKLFTVHSDIEEALQTRTIPIHVRETEKPEYPIVNLDKAAFGRLVYAENFLWFLDNILAFRDNELHTINGLASNQLDILDLLDLKICDSNIEARAAEIRAILFEKKRSLISERQVSQVSQVAGRNTELMFLCFTLSNIIKICCDDDIKRTFEQKKIEESERSELGYLGLLRDVLTELWTDKQYESDYMAEDGSIKISNKEIYTTFNERLKKEYDSGLSPAKFKEYMLEFGFTDALNRKKLEVPLPGDSEPKSRLCNLFTSRVLRKLGVEPSTEEPPNDICANVDDAFQSHCGDCGAILGDEWYNYGKLRLCRRCHQQLEIQKKKKDQKCAEPITHEDKTVYRSSQSMLTKPEDGTPVSGPTRQEDS
jgi:hypothetical protein